MSSRIYPIGLAALCLAAGSCSRIKQVEDFTCLDLGTLCVEKGEAVACRLADGTLDVQLSEDGFRTTEEAAYALARCKDYFSKLDKPEE